MNELITLFFAILAALSAAFGSPMAANKMPDRPAIVQSASASKGVAAASNANRNAINSTKPSDDANKTTDNSSKLNRVEIQGTVTSVKTNGATTTIVVGNQTVTLDSNTKLEGKLEVGVKVQIEAIKQANGSLIASQVEVKKADATAKPPDDKTKATNDGTKKDSDSSDKSGSDDSKSDNKSGGDGSDDDKSGGDSSSKSGSGKSGGGSDDPSGHR